MALPTDRLQWPAYFRALADSADTPARRRLYLTRAAQIEEDIANGAEWVQPIRRYRDLDTNDSAYAVGSMHFPNYGDAYAWQTSRPAPCTCECSHGGFCGGCGHAGCGGR